MRLTLRTLLAWLDDTLPPANVRQIGKQVAESENAKQIIERIRRVTRQRRLTIPGEGQSQAVDPNLVADYLDDVLDPEQTAEFEKACLRSDVQLAEVASAHQILSLVGQKAKVPLPARQRMYALVQDPTGASHRGGTRHEDGSSKPSDDPQTPQVGRFLLQAAPVALVVLLIIGFGWAAIQLVDEDAPEALANVESSATAEDDNGGDANDVPAEPGAGETVDDEENATAPAGDQALETESSTEDANADSNGSDGESEADSGEEVETTNPDPPGPIDSTSRPRVTALFEEGQVRATDGLLFRQTDQDGLTGWEALDSDATIGFGDRLVSLNASRDTIQLGNLQVLLIDEVDLRLTDQSTPDRLVLALRSGRIRLSSDVDDLTIDLDLGPTRLPMTLAQGQVVGLEIDLSWIPGRIGTDRPTLVVSVPTGSVSLGGDSPTTLEGETVGLVAANGRVIPALDPTLPDWMVDPDRSVFEQALADGFRDYFGSDRPLTLQLALAEEDENPDVARLAVASLAALDYQNLILPVLERTDRPEIREAIIAALRRQIARGPEGVRELGELLAGQDRGDAWQQAILTLLIGFDAEQEAQPKTYADLIELLIGPDFDLRVLAIDNLMELTNSDALGYDVNDPNRGYRAWREALEQGDIPITDDQNARQR